MVVERLEADTVIWERSGHDCRRMVAAGVEGRSELTGWCVGRAGRTC